MPAPRLFLAAALSLLLHAILLFGRWPTAPAAPQARPAQPLAARLLPPPAPRPAPAALLKNTLDADEPTPPAEAAAPAAKPRNDTAALRRAAKPAPRSVTEAAQKKLAEQVFYPAEAIARGLEGEVRVLIVLTANGDIDDVQLAAGSGHPLLDQAALRAAWAMGALPGMPVQQLILPVVFQLR